MGQKIKIALVANSTWNFYNFRLNLLISLVSKGFEVYVISPNDRSLESLLSKVDVNHIPLKNMSRKGLNPITELKLLLELKSIYKQIAPDLIFHYTIKPNIYGSLAAGQTGIKSIAITTGLGYVFTHNNFISFIAKQLYKISLKYSLQVWFLNEDDRSVFVNMGLVHPDQANIIRGEGVDTTYFYPIYTPQLEGDSKTIFLLSARMLYDKGIQEFVEAIEILKTKYRNVEGVLVGFIDENNPKSIPLKTLKKWQSSGTISFLGETSDIRPFISNVDCVVLPSFYREGIPRILLEASSMEKPIITSNQVGCIEVVADGITGFVCNKKDVLSLVEAMEKFMLLSEIDRKIMGKAGRQKIVREFDDSLIISFYNEALRKLKIGENQLVPIPEIA